MRIWITVGLYILLIYATVPFARGWQRALRALADGDFSLWMNTALVVASLAIGCWGARRIRGRFFWWLAGLLAATLFFAFRIRIPEERIHLIEYAGLGYQLVAAIGKRQTGWPPYLTVSIVGAAIGWGDELIQGLMPDRAFDWRDVGLNTAGVWIGLIVAILRQKGEEKTEAAE